MKSHHCSILLVLHPTSRSAGTQSPLMHAVTATATTDAFSLVTTGTNYMDNTRNTTPIIPVAYSLVSTSRKTVKGMPT